MAFGISVGPIGVDSDDVGDFVERTVLDIEHVFERVGVWREKAEQSVEAARQAAAQTTFSNRVIEPIAERVDAARHAAAATWYADHVIEPTVQGSVMVLDSPYQLTQATFRTGLRRWREGGLVGDRGFIPTSQAGLQDRLTDPLRVGLQMELPTFIGSNVASLFDEDVERLTIGDGYFVGGTTRERVDEARRSTATINGQTASIGRWVASPLEPGSTQHTLLSGFVDAAVAVAGPGELAVARSFEAAKAARAFRSADGVSTAETLSQRLFQEWGGLRRTRATVDAQRVNHALNTEQGLRTIERIAESDAYDIRRLFRGKIRAEVAQELAAATDPADVRRVLQRELGSTILARPSGYMRRGASSLMETARETSVGRTTARLVSQVPSRWIDIEDPTQTLGQVSLQLENVRATPATQRRWINRFSEATSRFEREELLKEFETETAMRMAIDDSDDLGRRVSQWATEAGVDEDTLYQRILERGNSPTGVASLDHQIVGLRDKYRRFVSQWTDDVRQNRAYVQDSLARGAVDEGLLVHGEHAIATNEPMLLAELVGRHVPMPDPVPLRRMFSQHPGLFFKNHDIRNPRIWSKVYDGLAGFEAGVFKPAVLLRLAWPIRVIGEEQLRMAAAGHSNAFTNPIHHIALAVGRGGKRGRLTGDALGVAFGELDEHATAMARGSSGYGAGRQVTVENWDVVDTRALRASDQLDVAVDAWAEQIAKVGHDPVVQFVLRHDGSFDELSEAFWVQMRATRENIMAAHPQGVVRASGRTRLNLLTREGSDQYLEDIHRIVGEMSGGDADLINALRTHTLDDVRMAPNAETAAISADFKRALGARADVMPPFLPRLVRETEAQGGMWAKGVEKMMGMLMSTPTNRLSRSPVFREKYWDEIAGLSPRISQDAADQILKNAEKAGVPKDMLRHLRARIGNPGRGVGADDIGSLSLAEADMLAKAAALDHTQDLLFDLSKRNQFFDAQRLIFPFGDAWAEVITRWAKLVRDNPQAIRRGSQAIDAGRRAGWFYEDPATGEEVFTYPMSDWVNRGFAGVDVPFKGRLQGLSLATEVLPGIGPSAQWSLSAMLPDSADYDWARELFLPFGEIDTDQSVVRQFYDAYAPTGPARLATAGIPGVSEPRPTTEQEMRELATAESRSFDYLISTGDYDIYNADPEVSSAEFQRAFEDGRRAGQAMMFARGIGNLVLPTAPSPDWQIEDLNGQQVSFAIIRQIREVLFEADPTTADDILFDSFGVAGLFSTNGRTVDLLPGRGWPPTAEAEMWRRENGDLVGDFPLVAHLFAPSEGEFDPAAYSRMLREGSREDLTYEQVVSDGLHAFGLMLYYEERDKIVELAGGEDNLTPVARRYLSDYDDWLKRTLTISAGGYAGRLEDPIGVPQETDPSAARPELERLVSDERVADTELAGAIRTYLEAENEVTTRFRELNPDGASGWEDPKAGRPFRTYLGQLASHLTEQEPNFAGVYESILRDRMIDGLREDEEALTDE